MGENMEDIYRRYTDKVQRVRIIKGSFEVEARYLEKVFGLLMSLAKAEDGDICGHIDGDEVLDDLYHRLLKTFWCIGEDVEPFPEVRPPRFIPEQV